MFRIPSSAGMALGMLHRMRTNMLRITSNVVLLPSTFVLRILLSPLGGVSFDSRGLCSELLSILDSPFAKSFAETGSWLFGFRAHNSRASLPSVSLNSQRSYSELEGIEFEVFRVQSSAGEFVCIKALKVHTQNCVRLRKDCESGIRPAHEIAGNGDRALASMY